jgi:hypothetical protein
VAAVSNTAVRERIVLYSCDQRKIKPFAAHKAPERTAVNHAACPFLAGLSLLVWLPTAVDESTIVHVGNPLKFAEEPH